MNLKHILILFFILNILGTAAQNFDYTLSDDSLVNYHASLKKIYHATRTELRPKIDGQLDDVCWKQVGNWQGGFIQQQPNQAGKPSQQTSLKILYDDTYLYIGLVCYDNEPEKIRDVLGRRDEWNGDIAGIALDSYFDKQTAFEFNITAAGQKVDLMHLGDYGWDYNWDAVWDGKASVGDSAWYGEMRIPFSQLRYADKEEHVWGMHVWRWIDRLKEEDQWKLIPVDAPAMVYIFGELHGIKNITARRNFELLPYAKMKYIPEPGKLFKADSNSPPAAGFGLDGKIGISSDFTLDYTINPDFGQVEADPSVLNLTSYEVFYEEKRPFFLEGNSILDFGAGSDLLFYSRRIGTAPGYLPSVDEGENLSMPDQTSILNALKFTGKNRSGLSLGIINSMTSREHAVISSESRERKETVEPFTNYFVGRVKQDFNEGNTVLGGMVTSTIRNIKEDHLKYLPGSSLVGGIDFNHNWLNRKYFIDFNGFFSRVEGDEEAISDLQLNSRHYFQRTDAPHLHFDETLTTLQGWGGNLRGGKRSGKFRLIGTLDWRSPGLELNDLGYLRQADYIDQELSMLYWINKPKGILNSYYLQLEQKQHWSYGGEKLGAELSGRIRLEFKNLWKLDLIGNRIFYEMDTRQLRGGPSLRIDGSTLGRFFVQTNSSKKLFLGGGSHFMWNDDKISWWGQHVFHVEWLISNRLKLSSRTTYTDQTDNNQFVMRATTEDDRKYVVGRIDRHTISSTLRAEFFVTPELSFQYYGNPYATVGRYYQFRKVAASKSTDITRRFTPLPIETVNGDPWLLDENRNLLLDLSESSPDFNFQEFRSNFVARWEYKTGSTIYFVWTNTRSRFQSYYEPSIINSLKGLNKVKADNAFMIKVSFWFSI
ncbi:hypothetical protein D1164_21400 [Mariniphaga sediminis]|uniref:Uncharacterized protein n=1 Tax=Mariniphaga sediminis TaxID=1628158 RepID=A0A399CYM2_9BACT|nr:DUF5916 domain-containing protein [Mariniphaga sediminis]RIH63160.1 hypothetical protein D1164_21400 [Mariniphaga sediminis]